MLRGESRAAWAETPGRLLFLFCFVLFKRFEKDRLIKEKIFSKLEVN